MEVRKAVDLDISIEMDTEQAINADSVSTSSRQVMSISPTDIDADALSIEAKDVMLTPRVLDQSAYDALSNALSSQIEKAGEVLSELRERFDQAKDSRGQAKKSSASLQERLRISARMLKAFQTQIDSVQDCLSSLGQTKEAADKTSSKLAEQIGAFEKSFNQASARFEQTIEELFDKRLKRFEEQLTDREAAVQSTISQVAESRQRIETLTNESEERITTLVTDTQKKVNEIHSGAQSFIETLTSDTKSTVDALLNDAKSRMEELVSKNEGLVEPMVTESRKQVQSLLDKTRQRVEALATEARDQVQNLLSDSEARMDILQSQSKERVETLQNDATNRADIMLGDVKQSVDSIGKLVESAEKNAAAAAMKSAKASDRVEKAGADMLQIIVQADQTRKILDNELLKAVEATDDIVDRSEKICRTVRAGKDELESAAARLEYCSSRIEEADKKREGLEKTRLTLARILEKLKPWEELLRGSDNSEGAGPHSLLYALDRVRGELSEDAARLSFTMKQLAENLENLVGAGRDKPTANMPAVMIEPRDAAKTNKQPEITTTAAISPKSKSIAKDSSSSSITKQ